KTIITQNNKVLLQIASITFKELIYNVMASLRTYCKHDPIMVQKILWMLNYLQDQPAVEEDYRKAIKEEIETMLEQAQNRLDSNRDATAIAQILKN
ncbi:MAG TPA: hypothetical protein VKY45_05900, partial [Marinilabiliaceae bacterium]|nr:hypothetical protein [Marinilabiliaceae bacterium]